MLLEWRADLWKRCLAKNIIPQCAHVVREEELVPESGIVIGVYDDFTILEKNTEIKGNLQIVAI